MRIVLVALSILTLLFLTGCDDQASLTRAFDHGHDVGYTEGRDDTFRAIYPGTDHNYSPVVGRAHTAFAALGALKIIASIAVFCILLVEKSQSRIEVAGKVMFGAVGSTLAFFLGPPLGVSSLVNSIIFIASPSSEALVWLVIVIAAAGAYSFAALVERIYPYVNGLWVEAWSILFAAAFGTSIIQGLVVLFFGSPGANNYLGANLLVGAFLGGTMYLAVQLLRRAQMVRAERESQETPQRKLSIGTLFDDFDAIFNGTGAPKRRPYGNVGNANARQRENHETRKPH
jgi:hypothetical protein